MRAGWAIFRIKLAEAVQYRAAGLSGSLTSIFWGLIEITVYTVFFTYANDRSAIQNASLTLPQTITYLWLTQVLFLLAPYSVDAEIIQKIDSGDVGVELCRPMDLYAHWFAKTAGGRIVPLLWRGLPVLAVGLLMPQNWRISPPASLVGLLLMLLSVLGSIVLCSAYGMLVTTVRMNIRWGNGPMYMILLGGMVLSGAYLPLQLWPDALQQFLLLQPFAGYLDIPLRLYLGTIAPANAAFPIGLQLFWSAVFIVLGRLIMRNRLRKTIIQGG